MIGGINENEREEISYYIVGISFSMSTVRFSFRENPLSLWYEACFLAFHFCYENSKMF